MFRPLPALATLLLALSAGCLTELPSATEHDARLGPELEVSLSATPDAAEPQVEADAAVTDPAPAAPPSRDATPPEVDGPPVEVAPATCDPGCGQEERCVDARCQRALWVWEAEDLFHGTGRVDAEGVHADPRMHLASFLLFGPYTSELPAGDYRVSWRLRTGPIDGGGANDVLAAVDVNNSGELGCSVCAIAFRNLARGNFEAPGRWQPFSVDFHNPGETPLEFRVYWTGLVDMTVDRVEVRRLP